MRWRAFFVSTQPTHNNVTHSSWISETIKENRSLIHSSSTTFSNITIQILQTLYKLVQAFEQSIWKISKIQNKSNKVENFKICIESTIRLVISCKKFRAIKRWNRCFLRAYLMQNIANTHLKKDKFGVVSVNFSEEIISWRRSIAFLSKKNCSRCYEYLYASVCNFLNSNPSLKYLTFLEFLDSIDVKLMQCSWWCVPM